MNLKSITYKATQNINCKRIPVRIYKSLWSCIRSFVIHVNIEELEIMALPYLDVFHRLNKIFLMFLFRVVCITYSTRNNYNIRINDYTYITNY